MNEPYQELVGEVDRLAERLSGRYRKHLSCRAGCSGCCQHHLAVFQVEVAAIGKAVASLPEHIGQRVRAQARRVQQRESRGEAVFCPLLVDDRCSIYTSRPVICRTQGLPLLFRSDDGTPEVDFCPLNFTAPGATATLEEDYLIPLDRINLKLAAANLAYCRELGLQDAVSGRRQSISDIILAE